MTVRVGGDLDAYGAQSLHDVLWDLIDNQGNRAVCLELVPPPRAGAHWLGALSATLSACARRRGGSFWVKGDE